MVAFKIESLVSTFPYKVAYFMGAAGPWKAALWHPHLSDTLSIIFMLNVPGL